MSQKLPEGPNPPEEPYDHVRAAWRRINARRAKEGKPPLPDPAGEPPPADYLVPATAEAEDDAPFPAGDEAAIREAALRDFDEASWTVAGIEGGLMPFEGRVPPNSALQPRLPDAAERQPGFALPQGPDLSSEPDPTEALLNGLIGDCRLYMREVAYHSARLASLAEHRVSFIDSACRLALAGANVGKVVARLRLARQGAVVDERCQRIVVERIERGPAARAAEPVVLPPGGEGGR